MMFKGFNIGLKVISLFLVPGAVIVLLFGGLSPLGFIFASSVLLIENQKLLQDNSWRDTMILWVKAIFFALFSMAAASHMARFLAKWIMRSGKNQLSLYIISNLGFAIFSGLYLIWQKVREGQVTKLFNLFDHIRWHQFFSGFFIHTVFMVTVAFAAQILTPVPASVLAIAMVMGLLVTGIQSWFEEVSLRQLPLLFFSETVASGKMSQTTANIFFLGISAVIFGMAHLQWFLVYGCWGVLSQMIFGLFTGIMALNLSGIEFSTGVHAANNVVVFVFLAAEVLNRAVLSSAGFLPFVVTDAVALSASALVSKYCFSDKEFNPSKDASREVEDEYRRMEASI
jgi:hypothetical protein